MEQQTNARRKFVVSAVAAGMAPAIATAQQDKGVQLGHFFDARDVGKYHLEAIEALHGKLKDAPPNSTKGLKILIDYLASEKVLTPAEADQSKQLVDVISKAMSKEAFQKRVDELAADIRQGLDKADSVAWALFQIVRWSAETAWKFASNNAEKVAIVIAKDLAGALSSLVGALGKVTNPRLLVGIALAGAVSSSIDAIYGK